MKYAIKVTTDYASGMRSESYFMGISSFCVNLTGKADNAKIFEKKTDARKALSEYKKVRGRRKNEVLEIVAIGYAADTGGY